MSLSLNLQVFSPFLLSSIHSSSQPLLFDHSLGSVDWVFMVLVMVWFSVFFPPYLFHADHQLISGGGILIQPFLFHLIEIFCK